MVLEYLSLANIYLNSFFAQHITFISHVLAAVFLILSESTINYRVITPFMDIIEGSWIGKVFLFPTILGTAFFIAWATFSIYLYDLFFRWLLSRYSDYLTVTLIAAFFLTMYLTNIRYRD
ncbi:hypothetical protein JXB27_03795 [Candidatus Woesearchaeota archaeon]|nr:hypothetical protein [Candidatus Woesearchaeota archaeon]